MGLRGCSRCGDLTGSHTEGVAGGRVVLCVSCQVAQEKLWGRSAPLSWVR